MKVLSMFNHDQFHDPEFRNGNGNRKRDLCGHVKWDPQVLRQNIKF